MCSLTKYELIYICTVLQNWSVWLSLTKTRGLQSTHSHWLCCLRQEKMQEIMMYALYVTSNISWIKMTQTYEKCWNPAVDINKEWAAWDTVQLTVTVTSLTTSAVVLLKSYRKIPVWQSLWKVKEFLVSSSQLHHHLQYHDLWPPKMIPK